MASQERNRRAGTENVQGILGMGTAIEEAYENIHEIETREEKIQEYLEKRIKNEIENIKNQWRKIP